MPRTALILGDQLMREHPALEDADRVLMVESLPMLAAPRRHRRRAHLVWTAMRRFAAELRDRGLDVEEVREADGLGAVLAARPTDEELVAAPPLSRRGRAVLERHGVRFVGRAHLLTDPDDFARWADGRKSTRMEDFYRQQRLRHAVLLASGGADPDAPPVALGEAPSGEPVGGRWNFDSENRRPPKAGLAAPTPWAPQEDDVDARVRADLDRLQAAGRIDLWGEDGPRAFAVTPEEARAALQDFLDHRLADFGPWQDAMVDGQPTLFHSLLSVPMNLGVLDPLEVVHAAEARYHAGEAPIESVEGFVRQVLGWREYVWGMYWWRTSWERDDALGADLPLPAAWWGQQTGWRCLDATVDGVRETGYAHHIERLMVLGMLGLTAGVRPWEMTKWFEGAFVDGAEWVMAPNSTGMILYADGGQVVTKPYAAGGAYVNRMSQHCRSCRYRPSEKQGEKACPVTALYWDFVRRHTDVLAGNRRTLMATRTWERFDDDVKAAVRERAARARRELVEGADAAETPGS